LEQSLMTPLKFIISGIKKLSKQHSQYGNQWTILIDLTSKIKLECSID
jgi:hypothetical protein